MCIQFLKMKRYVENPLAEWQSGINSRHELLGDPDGYRHSLVDFAMLAYQRHQVDSSELSEMLELTDAARLWALIEYEEAYEIGLFIYDEFPSDKGPVLLKVG